MKFNLFAAALAASSFTAVFAGPTVRYMNGFNIGSVTSTGACKTQAQYEQEFKKIKKDFSASMPGTTLDAIKFFSTSGCNMLMLAIPAANAAGVKLWPTVWAVPYEKFTADKGALEQAIRKYGTSWLAGVIVGSESLYREEIDPNQLASMIYDVKGMVQIALKAPSIPVGCADTWTSWEKGVNQPVINAIDYALMNGFPYWEGATPAESLDKLKRALSITRSRIAGKPLVVGETGWPTKGDKFGNAVPSVANLQAYWKSAACWLRKEKIGFFWFSAFDEPTRGVNHVEGNFGVATVDQKLKISLKC